MLSSQNKLAFTHHVSASSPCCGLSAGTSYFFCSCFDDSLNLHQHACHTFFLFLLSFFLAFSSLASFLRASSVLALSTNLMLDSIVQFIGVR